MRDGVDGHEDRQRAHPGRHVAEGREKDRHDNG